MLNKIYVLDTCVLLEDPNSVFSFQDSEVVIPGIALKELDKVKRYMDEVGKNARQASRLIHDLSDTKDIHMMVPLKTGGFMRIELNHQSPIHLPDSLCDDAVDNELLTVAKNLTIEEAQKEYGRSVILVSKNALLRVKADAIGITAAHFADGSVV